ncbi:9197_t:CDS:2 [Diversispora eburnea]|uniref:9197_t:CDS:1 n=1 Tax=Diversispora eburnea TaxID=1213867 RepID=A0A9N8YML1_9GLOM|nr:9197_t:CDS:2 [Diversispora eburnea]
MIKLLHQEVQNKNYCTNFNDNTEFLTDQQDLQEFDVCLMKTLKERKKDELDVKLNDDNRDNRGVIKNKSGIKEMNNDEINNINEVEEVEEVEKKHY